jgi:hypothetical protein
LPAIAELAESQFTVSGMLTLASAVLFDPLPLLLSVNA